MEILSLGTRIRRGAARALRNLVLILIFICSGCLIPGQREVIPSLEVTSPAFPDGGQIPVNHTCDGANRSPPLAWGPVPSGTAALAIIVTDTDAPGGSFLHWGVYNIPPATGSIPAGGTAQSILPAGSIQATNDFGRAGYGGPCPPRGMPHHYHFTVYALDSPVNPAGARDGRRLLGALEGHTLARGEIVGIYQRA
ncbi:MAG TPA: YbhB/YbcL family Raf kinase inhibitor-like protein [Methanomicrobiales archaeon]|nr:YbhB/YbcL family Raf kinase inhibitor-like protein [Methanomicrobiales archaeon]